MELSLSIFLIIYLICLLFILIMTIFNLYHSWRFGMNNFTNFLMMSIYIVILFVIIFFSIKFISSVDWKSTFEIIIF